MIRALDILISTLALAVLSPLLLLACVLIYVTGEGDIFFFQKRSGRAGKTFFLIKFATMTRDSASLGSGLFTEKNDSRFLPFGPFLRRTKINELPQLINVIKGDMSLVGWRPLVESTFIQAKLLSRCNAYDVMPGITGLSSIFGRREEEDLANIADKADLYFRAVLPRKVMLDDWWALNASLLNYALILVITVWALIAPRDYVPLRLLVGGRRLSHRLNEDA